MTDTGRPREVLLLADSDEKLEGLDTILLEAGYSIVLRRPDEASLAATAKAPPGLVIACLGPGDPRLLHFIEGLTDRLGSIAPATLVVTGGDDERTLQRLVAAGVRDFLGRPILRALVRIKVQQLFRAPLAHEPIGGYDVRRLLGSGGMASVYLAEKDGHEVAMKILHASHAETDPEMLARFRREAEILKLLGGQGAPRFFE